MLHVISSGFAWFQQVLRCICYREHFLGCFGIPASSLIAASAVCAAAAQSILSFSSAADVVNSEEKVALHQADFESRMNISSATQGALKLLTKTWQATYAGLDFLLPAQADIDANIRRASELILSGGACLQAPKAQLPPRGRPVANAGVRKRAFYEQGAGAGAKSRRTYTCKLCFSSGHTRTKCELRQRWDSGIGEGKEPAPWGPAGPPPATEGGGAAAAVEE